MAWPDLAQTLRTACLNTWPTTALFQPQGGPPSQITGVWETPPMLEDVIPGSSQGVSVVYFWVDIDNISPTPQKGDQMTIKGVTYTIFDPNVRPEGNADGGATLKLRRNS
jgi:hypothetical protein